MSVTPNYSWPLIEPTDYVTNLPADLETLADAIDATVKTVSDAQIPKSIVDAKGDLIAATAADTVTRVAVGTNGQVLTANSSATAGVEWAAPPTSGYLSLIPTGLGITVRPPTIGALTTGGITEDVLHLTPIYLPVCTLTEIFIRTASTPTPSSGNTTRLGIFRNGNNNQPSTLLLDAGTVNPQNASAVYQINISQAISEAGIYWLGVCRQATSGTAPNFTAIDSAANSPLMPFRDDSGSGLPNVSGYQKTGVTGAFADITGATLRTSATVIAFLEVQ